MKEIIEFDFSKLQPQVVNFGNGFCPIFDTDCHDLGPTLGKSLVSFVELKKMGIYVY